MDPVTGRFITPDPVKDYTNQYSYVGNNPVNRIDPTGMKSDGYVFSVMSPMDFSRPLFMPDLPTLVFKTLTLKSQFEVEWRFKRMCEDALSEAEEMAAKATTISDKIYWENRIAYIRDFILGKNGYYIPTYDEFDKKLKKVAPKGPTTTYAHWNSDGTLADAVVIVNPYYFQGDHSPLMLKSYIILESAHLEFARTHNQLDYESDIAYAYASESFAWQGPVEYLSNFYTHAERLQYPQDAGFFGIYDYYRSSNFNLIGTIDEILRNSYPKLWIYGRIRRL